MSAKELFKVRPLDAENGKFIVTIGNHLATKRKFDSAKNAQKFVESKDWDLIVSLICACIEARETELKNMAEELQNQIKEETQK
ncbi:hypothetical protein [Microvirus mar45]|uniref:Uncharacterized protein n=1 Tax=Microvirus mar45 TaxID=2851180 RepID=A0A8F5XPJ3_9VIRU|nr:hypothetical protein [Microvirus mar45]